MENILNFTPSGTKPLMVETKNSVLLMNNYYTKEDLQPISFSGSNLNSIQSGQNMLHLKTSCSLNTTARQGLRHNDFGVIHDPYIANRYYFSLNSHHSNVNNTYSYLVMSTEIENDLIIDKTVTSSQNLINYKIVDINKNYIYVTTKHIAGTGTYFGRINKNTGGLESSLYYVNPSARCILDKVYSNDRYLYMACRYDYSRWAFVRHDKDLGTTENIFIDTINRDSGYTRQGSTSIEDNVYCNGNKCYVYQPFNLSSCCIIGVELDTSKSFTAATCLRGFYANATRIPQLIYINNNYVMYRLWVVDNYLYLAVYCEDTATNIIANQGIFTFTINTDGTLNYIGYNQMDNDESIISLCYSSDKSILILGFWQSFKIAVRNEKTKQYEILNVLSYSNVASVGFDEYDRIWIEHIDNSVNMYSLNEPQSSTIEFEKQLYVHKGVDINSYVKFTSTNFINGDAIGIYSFELSGTSYFTENGLREIELQYTGGELTIPITVTGSDQLSCKAYYIKGSE